MNSKFLVSSFVAFASAALSAATPVEGVSRGYSFDLFQDVKTPCAVKTVIEKDARLKREDVVFSASVGEVEKFQTVMRIPVAALEAMRLRTAIEPNTWWAEEPFDTYCSYTVKVAHLRGLNPYYEVHAQRMESAMAYQTANQTVTFSLRSDGGLGAHFELLRNIAGKHSFDGIGQSVAHWVCNLPQ